MRGHSGQGLWSVGSSSNSIDPLVEPVPNKGGLVGAVSLTEVDREEPIPFDPVMSVQLGIGSFDDLDVWAGGKPNGLDLGPEKMLKSVEKGGPKMGLGFSGLRLESMEGLSYDGVDAEDLNIPIIDDSSGDRVSFPNISDEDAVEKRYEDQATNNGENYSSPPSYFYRDLIPSNSFGMEGSSGLDFIKDYRPLKMVTAGGRWGLIVSLGVGRIQEEEASPQSVDGMCISVSEDSALHRFSEYLGFSTIGYEDEILDLLRKIQSDQFKDRGKG